MVKDFFGYHRVPSKCCGAAIITASTPQKGEFPVCSKCMKSIKRKSKIYPSRDEMKADNEAYHDHISDLEGHRYDIY